MAMATPFLFQKREDVYAYGHPSLASRRGKRCLIMATPYFSQKREDVYHHDSLPEKGGASRAMTTSLFF